MNKAHPNATVAGGTTGAGLLLVWLLGNVFHVPLSAEVGVAIAGGVSTGLLLIGRKGLRGIWRTIVDGNSPTTGP